MKPVETTQIRVSAKEIIAAAIEGGTYTHSTVKADAESPETHNLVMEFFETPSEVGEIIETDPVIQNRVPSSSGVEQ